MPDDEREMSIVNRHEAAYVDLAESLDYQVEDAGVYQDVESGGGADA